MKEKHTRRPKVARTGRREEERSRGKEGRGKREGGREGQKDQRDGRYFQFTAKNQR